MKIKASFKFQQEKLQNWRVVNLNHDYARIFVKTEAHPDGAGGFTTTTELARKLSVGTENIPPRPLFRDYTRNNKKWVTAQILNGVKIAHVAEHAAQGSGAVKTLYVTVDWTQVAKTVLADFKGWVTKGDYYRSKVPNSPYTIKRKGSDVPLVDTHQLVNALHSEVLRNE